MGIWSRLGSIISSYLNDSNTENFRYYKTSSDPDLDAAYEELNDFLKNKETAGSYTAGSASAKLPPEKLRADFEKLGVLFGADEETCKTAYKKLLMIHHPDRHAGHESNYKKATEKSAVINAAWDRIEKWRHEK